ncbi:MAG: hypothetical protein AB8H47_10905 [Bacteroidia bacterium]
MSQSTLFAQDSHTFMLWGNIDGDLEIENSQIPAIDVSLYGGFGYFISPSFVTGLGGNFNFVPKTFLPEKRVQRTIQSGVGVWARYYLPHQETGLRWYFAANLTPQFERVWGTIDREDFENRAWVGYAGGGFGFNIPLKPALWLDCNLHYLEPISDPGFDVNRRLRLRMGINGLLSRWK